MTYNCETTQSSLNTSDVFRHTPYEYETTTDIGNSMTPIDPATIATVGQQVTDGIVFVPSLR